MAITFSCPSCKAHIQVGDDQAGQTGQCPRCERLMIIPSAQVHRPVLLDADGKPVPVLVQVSTQPGRSGTQERDEPETRGRRSRVPVEKKPSGPMWPWVLGTIGGIIVGILLFASFLALCNYRPPEPSPRVQFMQPRAEVVQRTVLAGRLEGQRAFLQNGVFQLRSNLTTNDPVSAFDAACRSKRYEVDLRRDVGYVIEMDSRQVASTIRVFDRFNNFINSRSNPGIGDASLFHRPQFTDNFFIEVSTTRPGLGEFVLTIREEFVPKPHVP